MNKKLLFTVFIACGVSSYSRAMIVKTTVTIDNIPRKAYHHTLYDLIATADHIIIDGKTGKIFRFQPSPHSQYKHYKELYREREAASNGKE